MDLREQLKNLFPDYVEQDFEHKKNLSKKHLLFVNMKKKEEMVSLLPL